MDQKHMLLPRIGNPHMTNHVVRFRGLPTIYKTAEKRTLEFPIVTLWLVYYELQFIYKLTA